MKVGFIGLGVMGKGMARNILAHGYELTVYDHHESSIRMLSEAGALPARSCREAAMGAEALITMLPNSPNVEEALFGEDGAVEALEPGSVVIDMSSISPASSRDMARRLSARSIEFLDAPVSGGEPKANDGTLAIMVGGKEDVLDKYRSLLETMASSVSLVGDVGAGNVAKLANQIIVACNIAAVAEAYCFAEKCGVLPIKVYRAIRNGLAGSTVLEQKTKPMLDSEYKPGFRIDLHIKDLANVMAMAQEEHIAVPLSADVMQQMQVLASSGRGTLDHSALAAYYEMLDGVTLNGGSYDD